MTAKESGSRTYIDASPELSKVRTLDLIEGIAPFVPWSEYNDILKDIAETSDGMEGYINVEAGMNEASNNVRVRFGLDTQDYIAWGHGAHEIIDRVILKCLPAMGKDFVVWGISPHFPETEKFARSPAARAMGIRYKNTQAPLETSSPTDSPGNYVFRKAIREIKETSKRKNVFIYASTGMTPTGEVIPKEMVGEFIDAIEERGFHYMIDEALNDGLPDEDSVMKRVAKSKKGIAVRSFSKILGIPDERLGYAVAGDNFAEILTSQTLVYNINKHSRELAARLTPDVVERRIKDVMDVLVPNKTALLEELDKLGVEYLPTHPATPFFTAKAHDQGFHERLLMLGVSGSSGVNFNKTHDDLNESHVRLAIPRTMPRVIELADRLHGATISGTAIKVDNYKK